MGLTALRGGYSKFKEGIPSDHRLLWVEFPLTTLFGLMDNIVKKVSKRKASDPRDRQKYISRSNKHLKKHNCLQKMKKLHSIPIDKFTIPQQQENEKLLRYITVT